MANENNNTKQLVSEPIDDSTVELQELTLRQVLPNEADDVEFEDDADTFEVGRIPVRQPPSEVRILNADLESRAATVSRLQFDLERLRSRLCGLEAEVSARKDISDDLNRRIAELRGQLAGSVRMLRQRNKAIRHLMAEIRKRAADARQVEDRHDALREERDRLETELTSARSELKELKHAERTGDGDPLRLKGQQYATEFRRTELTAQLQRTEAYADQVRRQLKDKTDEVQYLEKSLQHTRLELQESTSLVEKLESRLNNQGQDNRALVEQISIMQQRHNDEIRTRRTDLKATEDRLSQTMLLNEQLAADLEQSRAYRERIEQMLSRSDDEYRQTIVGLESEVAELVAGKAKLEEQLATRTEAINTLLAELTGGKERHDEIELSAPEIATSKDQINRMLIGHIDGQELRFPLFKDRLTIGRTEKSDLQLNLPHISRRHAVVITEGNKTRVVDWGSRNGVFVNARRITEHFLKSGDQITIGNANFRYEERPRRDI